uniref:Uncharacterized protein n=1 Tax=Arundo donax TaxID=35708 RepID=A0A0A9F008_ARUDO
MPLRDGHGSGGRGGAGLRPAGDEGGTQAVRRVRGRHAREGRARPLPAPQEDHARAGDRWWWW